MEKTERTTKQFEVTKCCRFCGTTKDLCKNRGVITTICYTCKKAEDKRCYHAKRKRNELDYYVIYYMPMEHRIGISKNPKRRMQDHRNSYGRNTTGWIVLECIKDETEAKYKEALWQSTLAINGLKT